MRDLTPDERYTADLLADAMRSFDDLPVVHPNDRSEFVRAIHAAQNIVLARPATEVTRSDDAAELARADEALRMARRA